MGRERVLSDRPARLPETTGDERSRTLRRFGAGGAWTESHERTEVCERAFSVELQIGPGSGCATGGSEAHDGQDRHPPDRVSGTQPA
jgi:hypothetical protein